MFWTIFLPAPLPRPPLKSVNFIFIVVSLSLRVVLICSENKAKESGANRNKCQKSPHVCKILVRNSGAVNGCTNFMGAWNFCVLSAGQPSMCIKFLVLGGGGILGLGGGSADFIFMGTRIFLIFA